MEGQRQTNRRQRKQQTPPQNTVQQRSHNNLTLALGERTGEGGYLSGWNGVQSASDVLQVVLSQLWKAQKLHFEACQGALTYAEHLLNFSSANLEHQESSNFGMQPQQVQQEPASCPLHICEKPTNKHYYCPRELSPWPVVPNDTNNSALSGASERIQSNFPTRYRNTRQKSDSNQREPSQSLISLGQKRESSNPVIDGYREQLINSIRTDYQRRQQQIGMKLKQNTKKTMNKPPAAFTFGYGSEKIEVHRAKFDSCSRPTAEHKTNIMEINFRNPMFIQNENEGSLPLLAQNHPRRESWKHEIANGQSLLSLDQRDCLVRQAPRANNSVLKSILDKILHKPTNLSRPLRD